jgi:hypothetical protein
MSNDLEDAQQMVAVTAGVLEEARRSVDTAATVHAAAKERRRVVVAELRRAGWTYPRLAETSGLSLTTVWKIAQQDQGASNAH